MVDWIWICFSKFSLIMETAMIHFDAHAIMIDKIFNQKQFNGYMIDENSVDENV